jgi:hypothetical protein
MTINDKKRKAEMLLQGVYKVLRAVVSKNRAGQKVTFSDHQVS